MNVEHERLVNGEATGDVLVLALNVSHLTRGGNWHCDITVFTNSRGKGVSKKHTQADYALSSPRRFPSKLCVFYNNIVHHTLYITSMS